MNTPPHTACLGVARPPEAERVARCASCAYYTRVTISAGLCEPPTDRGGEPFAVQCRPHFIACHLFKAKPTPKKNEHTPA